MLQFDLQFYEELLGSELSNLSAERFFGRQVSLCGITVAMQAPDRLLTLCCCCLSIYWFTWQVRGMNGTYIANQMIGGIPRTYITFDEGGEWNLIRAPEKDVDGNPTNCKLVSRVQDIMFQGCVYSNTLGGLSLHKWEICLTCFSEMHPCGRSFTMV